MSLPFTDIQARVRLAELVAEASTSQKVYSFNCLNYKTQPDGNPDFAEWPGLFTYDVGGGNLLTHGWVIRRVARNGEIRAGCEDFIWVYDVYGFYGFSFDNTTENAASDGLPKNSDDTFSAIVESVAAKFNDGQGNGQILINGCNASHEGIQFPVLSIIRAGEKMMHFAGGQIEIQYIT